MEANYEIKKEEFYFRTEGENSRIKLECSPHMHYQIEVCLLLEGETLAYIDSVEYRMKAGDLCIVFPNQVHQFKTLKKEKYFLVILNPDMLPELSEEFGGRCPESSLIRSEDLPKGAKEMMRKMGEIGAEKNEYKNIILKGVLLTFLGELMGHLSLTDVKSVSSHALKTVVNYCARNFSRDLSLGILEEELHISKYYISHLFSMKLKVRFNDYINSLRISDACRQLRQTDKTITEISECVGFNTLRTFNRAFVRQTGMSPSEYRRRSPQITRSVSMIG
ncbi:MAG: helix-turn-helix transcriptional regulator [Clostridia bacterium]|nr:helix-turn-helix transcriptional regulator [Clostridia bacterium]